MIEGVRRVPLEWKLDDRGFLVQLFHLPDNLFPQIKRIYIVGNFSKGIIRGFHKHEYENKYFVVIQGTARFVLVSTDENNKPKQVDTYILSSKNPTILIVPPRVYNGWQSLEENTLLIGISDKILEDSLSDDFRLDPFYFGRELWETKSR